ncbi:pentatricopeptide repeat-containing protein At3g02330, mitochondrial-like [Rutidosis leptorrhynchoides]|uniref:pentatricopeptide repeat-containing protein At3g02330, mitochondrial-like n=1 Tax=Rutidosis leptorrhynchoides TaxID=125765 RepID=UPI003A99D225
MYQYNRMLYNYRPFNYVFTSCIHAFPLNTVGLRGFSFGAHKLFDKSPERQEYETLVQGNMLGENPTKFELCTALKSCAKTRNLYLGFQIHARILHAGLHLNLFISSALVNFYAKCDAIDQATMVFNGMELHDQVSWTSIISGLSQIGQGKEALCLFKKMLTTIVRPNCFTYVSVISGCTQQESVFKCGELLHAHVIKLRYDHNNFVVSSLIDYYSKCGKMDKAVIIFEECLIKDSVLLSTMVSAYAHNQQGEDAMKLFVKMHNANVSLSEHALTSILDVCGAMTVLHQGRQVHAFVLKTGSHHNTFVLSGLIEMYSKCGNIEEAVHVFDQAVYKNNIIWTSMISAFSQSGRGLDALELFDLLVAENRFIPDHVCFTVVLTACNHAGLFEKGVSYFKKMTSDYNLDPEIDQYACLIDLYARKGDLVKAKTIMDEMPFNANFVMWSSFLSFCKEYGNVELGRETAYKLFELEPRSPVPYLILADIYAAAGLWTDVQLIRKLMVENGVRKYLAGSSWVEVDNQVHVFSAGDLSHPRSKDVHLELRMLNFEMRSCNKQSYLGT